MRSSLFTKILLWFFLNLVILGVVLFVFFQLRFLISPDSPLWGRSGNLTMSLSRLIGHELSNASQDEWNAILERYSEAYQVDLLLYEISGEKLAGKDVEVPQQIVEKITSQEGREFGGRKQPGYGEKDGSGHRGRMHQGHRRIPAFNERTSDPTRYWVGLWVRIFSEEPGPPRRPILVAVTDSLFGSGLYPDPMPWILVVAVIVFLSIAWWFPMVRSLTRPIVEMTGATEEISKGRFDVRVDEKRTDEIGRLGRAINRMASRLSRYIHGQKRFMSDVAHELGSPIARMQMAMGVVNEKIQDESLRASFEDVAEEVELMASLVNEFLSYSRAEISPSKVKLQNVKPADVVNRVIARESLDDADIRLDIENDIEVVAEPELLSRALANLIRNAVRYAGQAGPIRVAAGKQGGKVKIEVSDSGPGVPDEYIERIFDPFFRKESDRGRETGGAGLGLAIVKTCVDACQGTVTARNLKPAGFAVEITLNTADEKLNGE